MKARIVGWRVQPIVFADDGTNLTPVNVGPSEILTADWAAFTEGGWKSAVDDITAQVEALPAPDALPD